MVQIFVEVSELKLTVTTCRSSAINVSTASVQSLKDDYAVEAMQLFFMIPQNNFFFIKMRNSKQP